MTRHVGATFAAFLVLHVVVWTLVPVLTRHELDGDSMMHFGWSLHPQWSYSLHPPLLPWVISAYLNTVGVSRLNYILLSQINIVVAFIAVWMLARELLPPVQALLAVCLLELIPFYAHLGIRLNHTSLLISCWAVATLFFYYALTRGRFVYWILTGLLAALAMLGKYYSVALIGAMGFVLLFTRVGRSALRSPSPYAGMVVFLVLLGIHVEFVLSNEVGTIRHIGDYFYPGSITARLWSVKFVVVQIAYLSPLLLVFCLVQRRKTFPELFRPARDLVRLPASDSVLICYLLMFFPFLVTAVPAFLLGVDVSSRWGGPIWGSIGILLLVQNSSTLRAEQAETLLRIVFGFMIVAPVVILVAAAMGVHGDQYTYPGRELGQQFTRIWHEEFDRDLRIVGGDYLPANSLAFNSPDHPSVLLHMDFNTSPWITAQDIAQHGMLVVCPRRQACIQHAERLFPGHEIHALTVRGKRSLFSSYRTQTILYFFVPPRPAASTSRSHPSSMRPRASSTMCCTSGSAPRHASTNSS